MIMFSFVQRGFQNDVVVPALLHNTLTQSIPLVLNLIMLLNNNNNNSKNQLCTVNIYYAGI